MNIKQRERLRRAKKTRARIALKKAVRLSVHKTPKHIYVQLIADSGERTLAAASTIEKDLKLNVTGNVAAAQKIGQLIAERALKLGVKRVAFDRSGFKYHGRIKALAEAAREAGLEF